MSFALPISFTTSSVAGSIIREIWLSSGHPLYLVLSLDAYTDPLFSKYGIAKIGAMTTHVADASISEEPYI